MTNEVSKQFEGITKGMLETFIKKNADYGNSFDKSLDENGLVASKVRMEDKMNRFGNLIKNTQRVTDESLEDTLLDMANYAIMTVMWMRGQESEVTTVEMFADDNKNPQDHFEIGTEVVIINPTHPYDLGRIATISGVVEIDESYELEEMHGLWHHSDLRTITDSDEVVVSENGKAKWAVWT